MIQFEHCSCLCQGCARRMNSVEDKDNQYICRGCCPAYPGSCRCRLWRFVAARLPSVTTAPCDTSLASEAAPHDTTLTTLPSWCQLPSQFRCSPVQRPKLKRMSTALLLCLHRCRGGCCWGDQQSRRGSNNLIMYNKNYVPAAAPEDPACPTRVWKFGQQSKSVPGYP